MRPELSPLKQPVAIRPEFIARQETSLLVRQQGKAAASTKFAVFAPEHDAAAGDEKGAPDASAPREPPSYSDKPLLSADGKYSSDEERRTFFDASGLPLFDLYHTRRGSTWHIEVPGGKSPSLGFVEPQFTSATKEEYKVQLRNAAGSGEDVVLRVQGQDVWKLRTNVTVGDQVVMTAKRLDRMSVYLPGSKVEWQVEVAEGMDMALASAIMVVLATNLYTSGRSRGNIYIGKKD